MEKAEVPVELLAFWRVHNVPAELIPAVMETNRFFRVTALGAKVAGLDKALRQHGAVPTGVANVWQIDAKQGLSSWPEYGRGEVAGCDLSSAAAVELGLAVEDGHHVLDMCCSPGVKMLMACEKTGKTGSVTGLDFSEYRLAVTRNILRKYAATNVRLFCGDGKHFKYLAPPSAEQRKLESEKAVARRGGLPPPDYAPASRRMVLACGTRIGRVSAKSVSLRIGTVKSRRNHRFDLPGLVWASEHRLSFESFALYDRIMVDAECTTDGAIRHHAVRAVVEAEVRKAEAATNFERVYRTEEEVSRICTLQRALVTRAWVLLKPGGLLLYSTCSLLRCQNEAVVEALLESVSNAVVEPFEGLDAARVPYVKSSLKDAVYLRGGNSLFACRIRKLPAEEGEEEEEDEDEEESGPREDQQDESKEAGWYYVGDNPALQGVHIGVRGNIERDGGGGDDDDDDDDDDEDDDRPMFYD